MSFANEVMATQFLRNRLFSLKFFADHFVRTEYVQMKGSVFFPRGGNYEIAKIHGRTINNLLLQNHWANFNLI